MSVAKRSNPESNDLTQLKPTKPTMAMAKLNSMPVMNKAKSMARPRSPIIMSFICTSTDLQYIAEQHQRLYEKGTPKAIGNRVERHLEGHRNLFNPLEVNPVSD